MLGIILIKKMNLNSKNLNLLVVFDFLMREKNLSKAGRKLGLSQPAVSHSLERLRRDFADPLFVKTPGGVMPTPKAEKLYPEILKVMEDLGRIFEEQVDFDPSRAEARITLATTDYFEQSMAPSLLARLSKEAPGVTVVCRPLTGVLPKEDLASGSVDLATAGYFKDIPEGYLSQKLFDERFVCLMRKGHPAGKGKLTLDKYLEPHHALITLQGDLRGAVDVALEKLKKKRRVSMAVSNFVAAGWIAAESDLILTCPARLSKRLCQYLPLEEHEVPLKLAGFSVFQVWHQRTHREPLHRWFRATLHEVCRAEV
jgi:DNA-binding transcriptional LysR family regulator